MPRLAGYDISLFLILNFISDHRLEARCKWLLRGNRGGSEDPSSGKESLPSASPPSLTQNSTGHPCSPGLGQEEELAGKAPTAGLEPSQASPLARPGSSELSECWGEGWGLRPSAACHSTQPRLPPQLSHE